MKKHRYENSNPSTPVFEIDGDIVPVIFSAAMRVSTNSI
jgi:hypothetical protein